MSLIKRGKTWWIDFATPAGERIRRTASTTDKAQAQELHDKRKRGASRNWAISRPTLGMMQRTSS